jgi:hypothetical protein
MLAGIVPSSKLPPSEREVRSLVLAKVGMGPVNLFLSNERILRLGMLLRLLGMDPTSPLFARILQGDGQGKVH